MSGEGRLTDLASLRRIEILAVAWAAAAGLGYGVGRSWAGAAVLTGASAASIVAFRGLQRVVSALGPEEPAGRSPGPELAKPEPDTGKIAGKIGWRTGLGALVRLGLLAGIVAAGSFLLEPEHFPAIVLGFSTLPAALMTEGLWQVVRALRDRGEEVKGRDRNDGS